MNFGDLIHERRVALGLTLEQIGDAVGVGKSTVRKWEHGIIKNIRRDKILALANVLEINPAMLIDTRYWDDSTMFSAYGDMYSITQPTPHGSVTRIGDAIDISCYNVISKDDTDNRFENEKQLLAKFRVLNDKGKQSVLNYIDIVSGNPDMLNKPAEKE